MQGNKETQKDNLFQIIMSTALNLEVLKELPKYFRSARKESPLNLRTANSYYHSDKISSLSKTFRLLACFRFYKSVPQSSSIRKDAKIQL